MTTSLLLHIIPSYAVHLVLCCSCNVHKKYRACLYNNITSVTRMYKCMPCCLSTETTIVARYHIPDSVKTHKQELQEQYMYTHCSIYYYSVICSSWFTTNTSISDNPDVTTRQFMYIHYGTTSYMYGHDARIIVTLCASAIPLHYALALSRNYDLRTYRIGTYT